MEIMTNCDGVIIVGGDGTINEAITGFLRRKDLSEGVNIPIAFMPAGKRNYGTLRLFNIEDDGLGEIASKYQHVEILCRITANIIKEVTRTVDVFRLEKKGEEKPFFVFHSLDLGSLGNAFLKADKYWFFGQALRPYYPLINRIFLKVSFQMRGPLK